MGTCYKLILEDEFDWNYNETSKEERLKDFETEYGGYIERLAMWYGFVVYDIDKQTPYLDTRRKLIREYCDRAYYSTDSSTGIIEFDLPVHTAAVQAEINRMYSRRTPEEKRVAEDHIRHKLLMKAKLEEEDKKQVREEDRASA